MKGSVSAWGIRDRQTRIDVPRRAQIDPGIYLGEYRGIQGSACRLYRKGKRRRRIDDGREVKSRGYSLSYREKARKQEKPTGEEHSSSSCF